MKIDIRNINSTDEIYADFYNCPNCNNTDILYDFKYCPNCGKNIEWVQYDNCIYNGNFITKCCLKETKYFCNVDEKCHICKPSCKFSQQYNNKALNCLECGDYIKNTTSSCVTCRSRELKQRTTNSQFKALFCITEQKFVKPTHKCNNYKRDNN